jgi:D-aminoacyl-tRNA deacylase
MRAVVQRVSSACVTEAGRTIGAIGSGVVVLLGVHRHDSERECDRLAEKIVHLRIFPDENGKMNCSLADLHGEMLIVSQFTLYGDCRKGRRPGYSEAAPPDYAEGLYNRFVEAVGRLGIATSTGRFQATMEVSLTNDGPVTLLIDSAGTF